MLIFPAIDLYEGKAVRLYKGDYSQMTVYHDKPWEIAKDFRNKGASCIHLVDLEGAKTGETPNLPVVKTIVEETDLFTQIGGGIRSMTVIERYLEIGVDRVILGTAAVNDRGFLTRALAQYGSRIAVGVDVRDGYVAIKGWTERSAYTCEEFCAQMVQLGAETLICTDISRDGTMRGTNLELYHRLSQAYGVNILASGGVSSLEDVAALRNMALYGAIIGKAYYTGAIALEKAIEVAK